MFHKFMIFFFIAKTLFRFSEDFVDLNVTFVKVVYKRWAKEKLKWNVRT